VDQLKSIRLTPLDQPRHVVPDIAGHDLGSAEQVKAARNTALGLSAGGLLTSEEVGVQPLPPGEELGLAGNPAYLAAKRSVWNRQPAYGTGDDTSEVIQ